MLKRSAEKDMATLGLQSLQHVLREWSPSFDDHWKSWIRDSYAKYRSNEAQEHLEGVRQFAIILGDSGAPELCILVALYGVTLEVTEKNRDSLETHIRIITFGLGIERHRDGFTVSEGAPVKDFGDRSKWLIDRTAWERLRDDLLARFGGDRRRASDFSVRMACYNAGVISSNEGATFESLNEPDQWKITEQNKTQHHKSDRAGGSEA